jgi:hypothetical protein
MKNTKILDPQITINPKLKSNPFDPFIQKKIVKATEILNTLKKPM